MSSYEYWRSFAASWGTIYFAAIFFIALIYTMWPSKRKDFEEASHIPLIED
ncbi:MAG: cbb3-type cytochrome c oxidase subunit 3 [Hyphomicrobiales bacterium]|nr:cbb3-type cytochrome c oxidase subunit 3 [Hyphomicrobiales bacterium]